MSESPALQQLVRLRLDLESVTQQSLGIGVAGLGELVGLMARQVHLPGMIRPQRAIDCELGEDGIIQQIFNRIGTSNRIIVEVGVECNSVKLLIESCSGLWLAPSSTSPASAPISKRSSVSAGWRSITPSTTPMIAQGGVSGEIEEHYEPPRYFFMLLKSGHQPRPGVFVAV
jgi:hypothetical protein